MYLTNRKFIGSRIRAAKTFIWSTLLFGFETWMVNRITQGKLEAAEMWVWRKSLKMHWIAGTNEDALRQMRVVRKLMTAIKRRQMRFLGNVMRGNDMEGVALTGMVEGRRARRQKNL